MFNIRSTFNPFRVGLLSYIISPNFIGGYSNSSPIGLAAYLNNIESLILLFSPKLVGIIPLKLLLLQLL